MSLDETIVVVEYDPAWPEAFRQERKRICSTLRIPKADVEHIGSTAVPGLAAKPIVDLMLGVAVYPPAEQMLSGLAALGYECLEEAGVAGRVYCRRRGRFQLTLGAAWRRSLGQELGV